jgi:hypothetical protein
MHEGVVLHVLAMLVLTMASCASAWLYAWQALGFDYLVYFLFDSCSRVILTSSSRRWR